LSEIVQEQLNILDVALVSAYTGASVFNFEPGVYSTIVYTVVLYTM
jgi:hypothetical protein